MSEEPTLSHWQGRGPSAESQRISSGGEPLTRSASSLRRMSGRSKHSEPTVMVPTRFVGPILDLDKLGQETFSVDVLDFKVNSGLVLSYTVYTIRWKFLPTGASGLVEHRYSDFLTLSQYLQKKYPGIGYAEFPEKRRFVTITTRTAVARERLALFKVWLRVFRDHQELWSDPKVQEFFALPDETRRINSGRGHHSGRQLHSSLRGVKATAKKGHRRTGSDMTVPVTFVRARRDSVTAPSLFAASPGDIRRSGSDVYLSQTMLIGDDGCMASSMERKFSAHIENTPDLKRSGMVRPVTPPSVAGDISPVFARKSLAVVEVPKTKFKDERVRNLKDFEVKALLGRGGFGSVFLATELKTGLVVAIKRMAKKTLRRTTKVEHVKMELKVLREARIKQNRWIVQLHYSFQDENYLYLAMQYCPGGDLRHLMENCEFDELTARLFAAEMCVCVHQLHAMGFVHRDLKPDNFLISQRGHLKLADFGLSVQGFLDHKGRTASVAERGSPTQATAREEKFTQIVVYFPASAGEVRQAEADVEDEKKRNSLATFDRLMLPEEEEDEEDFKVLRDDRGRRYQRVKIFITDSTTCSDVIDTIKLRLDIRKNVPYMLLELAFIDDHVHERVVRPEEKLEPLWETFDQNKFVFRRLPQPSLARTRNRSLSNYSDASQVAAPLSQSRQKLYQVVGSPNYMAKEILLGEGYENVVDWWSVGCIIFEMLYGVQLFSAPTPEGVFAKILSTTSITFPSEPAISAEAKSLMSGFLSPPATRIGAKAGLEEVQKHPWFQSVRWSELQYSEPPFLPELESQLDTGYFPDATDVGLNKYISSSDSSASTSASFSRSGLDTSFDGLTLDEMELWRDFDWSWFT